MKELRARLQALAKCQVPNDAPALPTPTEDQARAAGALRDFAELHVGNSLTGEGPIPGPRITPAWTGLPPLP